MRLFVVGNINSGKSYFIEKIKNVLPNYKVLKIDDYRINNCDGSLEKELKMWNEFPKEIAKYNDAIVELSGGGKVAENIVKLLDDNSFLTIYIDTDANTCIERRNNKNFQKTPYPKEFSETIEDTIMRLGKDFDEQINKTWAKSIKIIKINSDADVNAIPLMQYHLLFKLRDSLKDIKGSLFTFGSTGRGTMKKTSDVDTYFLCEETKDNIFKLLSNKFQNVKIMNDEFVIRENGILLEMNYINDIKNAFLFYNRSLIKDPYKTILKDDYNIIKKLVNVAKEEFDKEKEIKFTIERLDYFVESLPILKLKDDDYKYYFHNNIVIHEYLKLKAFLNGVFDYSYLPLNGRQYLSEEEWKDILFNFDDDKEEHYKKVRVMCDEIIKKVRDKYDKK